MTAKIFYTLATCMYCLTCGFCIFGLLTTPSAEDHVVAIFMLCALALIVFDLCRNLK